jgi:hypothetical protein
MVQIGGMVSGPEWLNEGVADSSEKWDAWTDVLL